MSKASKQQAKEEGGPSSVSALRNPGYDTELNYFADQLLDLPTGPEFEDPPESLLLFGLEDAAFSHTK
jgi:hypothetical protein